MQRRRAAHMPREEWHTQLCSRAIFVFLLATVLILGFRYSATKGASRAPQHSGQVPRTANPWEQFSRSTAAHVKPGTPAAALPLCQQPSMHAGGGVFVVPELLDDAAPCRPPLTAAAAELVGAVISEYPVPGLARSVGNIEVVLPLPPTEEPPPLPHDATYGYQKRNVRNFILFLRAQLAGQREWMDWCQFEDEGVNCMLEEEAGFLGPARADPLPWDVLDNGADQTGAQMRLLKPFISGQITGFNVNFFSASDFVHPAPNTSFVFGPPGKRLPFPDQTFDLVASMNVLEHVADPDLYLRESARVLKPGGYLYLNWQPSWSSARGHHVHPGMVEEWAAADGCTAKPAYANDGSVIADWSHLLLSRGGFRAALEATSLSACPGLAETVTQYVYEHSDLNRVPYEDVVTSVKLLRDVEILQVHALKERGTNMTEAAFRGLVKALPRCTHFRLGEIAILARKQSLDA